MRYLKTPQTEFMRLVRSERENWNKDEDISAQAMEFAYNFNLPATYDAHYLALALREEW